MLQCNKRPKSEAEVELNKKFTRRVEDNEGFEKCRVRLRSMQLIMETEKLLECSIGQLERDRKVVMCKVELVLKRKNRVAQ